MTEDSQNIIIFQIGDSDEKKQLTDLRDCLIACGADGLSKTTQSLTDVIKATAVIGSTQKYTNPNDIESILSSLMSLLSISSMATENDRVPAMQLFAETLASDAYCEKATVQRLQIAVHVLNNLFQSNEDQADVRDAQYHIYLALIELHKRAKTLHLMPVNMEQLEKYFEQWKLAADKRQNLLRTLIAALSSDGQAPAEILLALLETYASSNAQSDEALKYARTAVTQAIADPKVFVMDHFAQLKPVQDLQKQDAKLWSLLKIFINGTLSDYDLYMKSNGDYVRSTLQLNESDAEYKMRLLTLISLVEQASSHTYDDVRAMLRLASDDDVEALVIQAIERGCIRAKLDGAARVVHSSGGVKREFGEQHWKQLRQQLNAWNQTLKKASAQIEQMNEQLANGMAA